MFRFIALLTDPRAPDTRARNPSLDALTHALARSWRELPPQNGLRVFARDAREGVLEARPLPRDVGVLLGMAFPRPREQADESPALPWRASHADAHVILETQGRWLIDHCWGNYVAIVRDVKRWRTSVIKDPTGELPCLVAELDDVTVIFSSLADLLETGLFSLALRRSYLAARVLLGGLVDEAPLEGVETIGRGECLHIDFPSRLRRHEFYWHPSTFVARDQTIEDADLAARAMRATVRACSRTWARLHEGVLHRLSGGLDSSIVAAQLRDAGDPRRLRCYTYYNPRGRSDERPWARLVADRLACEHVECPVAPHDIELERALDMAALPEPVPVMGFLLRSTLEPALAARWQATAVFCGDGGDSGFGGEAFAYSLSDYLGRHIIGLRAVRLATQIASLTEQSSWAVLVKSLRRSRRGGDMEPLRRALSLTGGLVNADLKREIPFPSRFPHPWFSDCDRVPWATIRRLGTLLSNPQCYTGADVAPAPEVIAPLYAQPAIELFLRIPLYLHFEGGRERGLARRAFASDVPEPILRRLWKDRAPGFYDELVHRNRAILRETLLDGILVREGLLDRGALETTLSTDSLGDGILPTEVFRHLDVEIWARSCERHFKNCARA